jgi:hypothetical protein
MRSSLRANSHSASQEIPHLLWNSKDHYNVHNSPTAPIGSLYSTLKVKVELSLCFLTEYHAMKTYWGVEV